jgi:FkbM family methyltransferase
MTEAAAPWHLRLLRDVLRRLPRGQYGLLAIAPSRGQFVARLAGDAGAARFHCDLADQIAKEAFFGGLYEPPVTRVVQRFAAPGATIVDVGANWGYFTLVTAAAVGPAGRVIALEPEPRLHAALEHNVRLNQFQHVTTAAVAASSIEGTLTLAGYRDHDANRGVSRVIDGSSAERPSYRVAATTIDTVTAGCPRVDLVKIDVEGAEDAVLAGMQVGLSTGRYRAVVLELHPALLRARGVDPDLCLRQLRDAGYAGWTIDCSPGTYRRAASFPIDPATLLKPLDAWQGTTWPHLLWQNSSDEHASIRSASVV